MSIPLVVTRPIISVTSVDLIYPVLSARAQSIRNSVANFAVGGRLLRDGSDIIHVNALSGISFSLSEGDRLGIIGHNGSGKTTLLKVIAGIYEPTKGAIEVNGRITSMIDIGLGLDSELTGRENIINMGRMRGISTRQILKNMDEIIEFSDLGPYIDLPIKTFSSGMSSRLVFSVATTLEPDILLFDEWLSTGDAGFVSKAKQRVDDLMSKARALLLASHSVSLINDICNKLLVLESGSQVYFGAVEGWDFDENKPR